MVQAQPSPQLKDLPQRRWSVNDYHCMIASGILTKSDEVSHSTLNYDRNHKAKVYAKANIPEYWVVDVNQQQILVFREPQEDTYQVEQVLGVNDTIIPLAFPDVVVELSHLLV